ncbi:ABC transporter integral membrane type 1 [Penicillium crustosum]|uniref:ABC transporter integral membrane type 1 n=1 Tax=Penicillium crustosum TaxID=36656 RepID=UPI0023932C29|nr:ABC transporter integral membrane type 1 [Penicillium crustosum]KAJ5401745.1 ABC transporter integral membrane type 1 [Penicillium crustosum]
MAFSSAAPWAEDTSENAFGPVSHLRPFDFTITFEQAILSIIPSTFLLLAGPTRILHLSRCQRKTRSGHDYFLKLAAASINFALQLSLLVLWSVSVASRTSTSIPSAALGLANSTIIIGLSYVEDIKSTCPSSLLTVYLLLSILFDATQARTLWLTHRVAIAAVQSAIFGTKLTMLLLETRKKTSYLKSPYKEYPPEATSGIVNQSFVWWLNRLFLTGYQKIIESGDLFALEPGLGSGDAGKKLKVAWEKHGKAENKFSLPWAFFCCFWWEFLAVAFPRVCMIGFNFAQPFMITAVLVYIEEPITPESWNRGYGLIGATFLIYLGLALSNVHYRHRFSRVDTLFRGTMISLIYDRTLALQDGLYAESAALTLMSTDIDGIIEHLENFNDVWARTVEVAIGTWLLQRQVGATCVVPLILTIACLGGQKLVAKTIGKKQQNWNLAIQKRIQNTSSVLGSIKATKISGLSGILSQALQGHRERELFVSRAFFKGIMWLNGLGQSTFLRVLFLRLYQPASLPRIWSPVITFIVYAVQAQIRGDDSLTTVKAFTALSIITLVTTPAERLLAVLPQIAAAMGCFQRIHEYMVSDTVKDSRVEKNEFLQFTSDQTDPEVAIALDNVTVLPSQKAAHIALTDVSFKVPSGSLVIIIGPVGSGKTTLLKTILGELSCLSGTVSISSRKISYCSQNPWLLNTTIKKSITGISDHKVDEKWYKTVIYSCCLDEDIRRWPDGDQSEIGSKGLALSGGQKQRVALARSVYSRHNIALLDDVMSALDVQTQEMIIQRLFSRDGTFRLLGTTVVLATHNSRLLGIADGVVSLTSGGRFNPQTTGSEAINNTNLWKPRHHSDAQIRDGLNGNSDDHSKTTSSNSNPISDSENMDRTRQIGDLSIYYYYARTVGPVLCAVFFVGQVFSAFAENFPQVWLSKWTTAGGEQLPLYLSVYTVLALAASLFTIWCLGIVFLQLMPKSAARLHWLLLDTTMRAPLSFFSATDSGVTLNRFSQDMTLVDLALPGALMSTADAFFGCIATIGLIATGSPFMATTIPVTLIVLYFLQKVYLKTSRQLRYLDLESRSPLYSHFAEALEGLPTIRAFGWQDTSTKILTHHLDQSQKPYYMLLCAQRWLNLVLDIVVMALATVVVMLAVMLRNSTDSSLLGVALNNILGFNQLLSYFITSWTNLETSLGAIARVKSFVETTPCEDQPGIAAELPTSWPNRGEINILELSLRYPDGTMALDNISMYIRPGEKIGICGRTGSGKSSLTLAMLRLVDFSHGNITIDQADISKIAPTSIRERLIAVPQDPFTLLGTIRYNADITGLSSDSQIISVLKQIGVWAAIESRGGLDALLEDHPLSQGEQQLFCLARAILKRHTSDGGCQVLILDEATSSLDAQTDRRVQEVMREAFHDCTVFSIAHRLDTIIDFDRIAVLDAGCLVEFDSPQNLLSREGLFKHMYSETDG